MSELSNASEEVPLHEVWSVQKNGYLMTKDGNICREPWREGINVAFFECEESARFFSEDAGGKVVCLFVSFPKHNPEIDFE